MSRTSPARAGPDPACGTRASTLHSSRVDRTRTSRVPATAFRRPHAGTASGVPTVGTGLIPSALCTWHSPVGHGQPAPTELPPGHEQGRPPAGEPRCCSRSQSRIRPRVGRSGDGADQRRPLREHLSRQHPDPARRGPQGQPGPRPKVVVLPSGGSPPAGAAGSVPGRGPGHRHARPVPAAGQPGRRLPVGPGAAAMLGLGGLASVVDGS